MSEPVTPNGPARRRARMQTWGLIGIALALYGVLRLVFGPCRRTRGIPFLPTLAVADRFPAPCHGLPSPDALSRVGLSQGRGHRRPAFTAARTSVIVAARDEIANLDNER